MLAVEIKQHLVQLREERALVVVEGLAGLEAYMADLEEEIEHRRHVYTLTAVAEIASLRAELAAPSVG